MQNSLVPVLFRPPDAGEPGGAAAHDVGHLRDGFHVVDRGRAAVEAHIGRKRRLQSRHSLLAFEAFKERRLLAADVGAGAVMHDDVEVETVDVVLADELCLIGLRDRRLQPLALADEFAANVDVAGVGGHGAAGDQASFDQKVRIVAHDLAVLAGAGLRLVGVDHEIMRAALRHLLGHERPFQSGGKSGAAAAALAGRLALVDEAVAASRQDRLGAVPGATGACSVEAPIVLPIEILKRCGPYRRAFSFLYWRLGSISVVGPPIGAEFMRSICGPGFGVFPAERSLMIRARVSGVRSS